MIIINFFDLLDYISYKLELILCDDNLDWVFKFFIVLFNQRNV
jgi:hypothetical protein